MPRSTARRFLTDIDPERSAFARDVLLATWRSLVPDALDTPSPLRIRDRLRLLGCERLVLSDRPATNWAASAAAADVVPAASLVHLWSAAHPVDSPGPECSVGVVVRTGLPVVVEALAAALAATAGESDAHGILVLQLDPRDGRLSHALLRAVRRISDLPVSLVVHDGDTGATASRMRSCSVLASADGTAAVVASSLGVPVVPLGSAHPDERADSGPDSVEPIDAGELWVRLRVAATSVAEPDEDAVADARTLAFALDAWQRGRADVAAVHQALERRSGVLVDA